MKPINPQILMDQTFLLSLMVC